MPVRFILAGLVFPLTGSFHRRWGQRGQRGFTGGAADHSRDSVGATVRRRRSCCYANSRLLPLPRYRWARPPWRRPRPRPGACMVVGMAAAGMVAGTAAIKAGGPPPSFAGHPGYYGWGAPRFYVGEPGYYGYGNGGCYVRQLVPTPWGPRWRLINRCY